MIDRRKSLKCADRPGKTLFLCHQRQHMDFGFMPLLDYA